MTLRLAGATLALLAVLIATPGCAAALVNAEGALYRAIAVTQDTADAMCDVGIQTPEKCRDFNIQLIPAIASAKEFNKAVQENNYAEVPAAMTSVLALRNAAELFFLDENLRMQIRARLDAVYSLISTLRK
jgi:hypothetical protein